MANSYQFDPKYSRRMGRKTKIVQSIQALPKNRFDIFKQLINLMNKENDRLVKAKKEMKDDQ